MLSHAHGPEASHIDSGRDLQPPRGFSLTGPICEGGFLRIGDLRLAVSMRAGPPIGLRIRSRGLGVEEFTDRILATKPAGFEVGPSRALIGAFAVLETLA